jgi:hypothetical protein
MYAGSLAAYSRGRYPEKGPTRADPEGSAVQARLAFPAPSGRLREYAGDIAAYCDPIKIAAHISSSAFPGRSRQSGKTGEAFDASRRWCLSHSGQPRRRPAVLIRISTDIEINGNEQPEGISLAGKDIRCPCRVTSPAAFVASCAGRSATFRSGTSASRGRHAADLRREDGLRSTATQCLEGAF